jgi:type I restriction enzyme, S subunit
MSNDRHSWPEVRLGDILACAEELVALDDVREYVTITVKRRHGGLEPRERLFGHQIKTKKQYRLLPGAFIISRIQCWHQAYAMVPDDIPDNMIASTNYDQFTISPKVDHLYFWWFSHSPQFTETIRSSAFGVVIEKMVFNRDAWLEKTIPLPPLDEQRRIVSRIEELAAKVNGAQTLRMVASREIRALLDSAMNDIWRDAGNWHKKLVHVLATPVSGQVDPRVEPFASLPHINGESIETGTGRLLSYRLAREDGVSSGKFHFPAGAVLYSKIRPYLRKAVQVPVEGVCSADVYAFKAISPELEPRFFMYSLIAPPFTTYANSLSGRTRMPKLNQKQLFAFELSYPPLPEQRRIVAYLDGLQAKVDALKRLHSETAAELDAFMPSILAKAFRGEL